MQKINIKWLWFLGGLLLLNLGLLLYMLLKDKGTSDRRPQRTLLHEALNFSPEQNQQFELLRKEHHQMMQMKNGRISVLKDKLLSNFGDNDTAIDAKQIASEIGQLVGEIDLETRSHFQDVRSICTETQRVKFDEIIKDVLREGRPPNGVNGPPNGAGGPPPRSEGPPPNGPPIGPGMGGAGPPPPLN
jgi:hypothetical protein